MRRFSTITRTVALGTVSLALAGCDEVELPASVESEFSIFQIQTVTPADGSSVPAGSGQQAFEVDITYQRTDAEIAADPTLDVAFWIETVEQTSNRAVWQGDLTFESTVLTGERGSATLSGSFRMPGISPFCGAMTHIQAVTIRELPEGTETTARLPDSELSGKESLSEDFEVTRFQVSNRPTLTRPCVITMESLVQVPDRFLFRWGQPVWIWGQRMPTNVGPRVDFAGGESIDFTIPTGGEVDPDATGFDAWQLVQTWIPTNATDGAVRVFFNDVEVDYGGDRNPTIAVDETAGDFFEPNDSPDQASTDPVEFGSQIFAVNPGLTIDDQDLEPDESLPFDTIWGRGDWWNIETSSAVDVCGIIFMDARDDQDLFLFNNAVDQLLDFDIEVGTEVALVIGNSAGATTLKLWVAPFDVQTNDRRYELFALDCALIGINTAGARRAEAGAPVDPAALKAGGGGADAFPGLMAERQDYDVERIREAVERIRKGDIPAGARIPTRLEPGPAPFQTLSPGIQREGQSSVLPARRNR